MHRAQALCCEQIESSTQNENQNEFMTILRSSGTGNWYDSLSHDAKNAIDSHLEPYFSKRYPGINLKQLHIKFIIVAGMQFLQRNSMDSHIDNQFKNCRKPRYALDKPMNTNESIRLIDKIYTSSRGLFDEPDFLSNTICHFTKDPTLPDLFFTGTIEQQLQYISIESNNNDTDLGEMEERNAAWKKALNTIVTEHDQLFIAVGAMHLVGETGLLEWAKQSGYAIEEINDEDYLFDMSFIVDSDIMRPYR